MKISQTSKAFPPIYPNPDKFLGGSTHLRSLSLTGIPIPNLPKILLSSTNLVDLRLKSIPHDGYFSPDAMVTALSALTRLKILHFEPNYSARPNDPNWEHPSSLLTRTVLPSLTVLDFSGYNEEFIARIDTPLLDYFHGFCCPRLQYQLSTSCSVHQSHTEFPGT